MLHELFAYEPGIELDVAVIHLLHRALSLLPGEPGNAVRIMFFILRCIQHHSAWASEEQVGEHRCGRPSVTLDSESPHLLSTVYEDTGLCVWHGGLQYRGLSGNYLSPLPLLHVYCRLCRIHWTIPYRSALMTLLLSASFQRRMTGITKY